jgi:hypothetical protein
MITDKLERCNNITKVPAMTEIRTCDLPPISESINALDYRFKEFELNITGMIRIKSSCAYRRYFRVKDFR